MTTPAHASARRGPGEDASEAEPLLQPPHTEDAPSRAAAALGSAKALAARAARRLELPLGACLAATCVALGAYTLYILCHAPALLAAARGASEARLESASLIDAADDAVLFAADVRFPRWGRRAATIARVNATVYHDGAAVGWLHASGLTVAPPQRSLSLAETFHIVNSTAMERLLGAAASSRRIAVSVHARVALSGFGRLLPTVAVRRAVDVALPPLPPALNATVRGVRGPVEDARRGGVTARAAVEVENPSGLAANLCAVHLDVYYRGAAIAAVRVGPASVRARGASRVPVEANVRPIAGARHEAALADLIRSAASGARPALTVSGSDPLRYGGGSCAPAWLRRALHGLALPVRPDAAGLPSPPAAAGDIVRDVLVSRLYAYWSASDGYSPWASIAGEAAIEVPNPSAANVTFEVESLVPRLRLLDAHRRPFASAVGVASAPVRLRQTAPQRFALSCDFDRLGLVVVPGQEPQFTRAMRRAVVGRHMAFGVDGSVDAVLRTSLGRIRIDAIPLRADIDWRFGPGNGTEDTAVLPRISGPQAAAGPVEVAVTRIHVEETRPDLVAFTVGLAVQNPLSYGAYITDLGLVVKYAGLHVATVSTANLSLAQGPSDVAIRVDFYNHPADPRQQQLFLDASSGRNVTIEVAGFPNCTSIRPLEASLRDFAQELTIDTSRLRGPAGGGGGGVVGSFPQVLQDLVFHVFAMSLEATVVNPVSGADIWLQSIDAVGYYKGNVPLGTLQYDFTAAAAADPRRRTSNGLLLPFKRPATTPHLPISANDTSIGWDLVRRAIGGSLDVDVLTRVQVRIGNAQLNVTAMGRGAPVRVRF